MYANIYHNRHSFACYVVLIRRICNHGAAKGAYTRAMFQSHFCTLGVKTGWGKNLADFLAHCDWLQLRSRTRAALHACVNAIAAIHRARGLSQVFPPASFFPWGTKPTLKHCSCVRTLNCRKSGNLRNELHTAQFPGVHG